MAQFKKETPEETAFRKKLEVTQSTLDTVMGATLPEGSDFHYCRTFEEFRTPIQDAEKRLKALLQKLPGAEAGAKYDLDDPEEAALWLVEVLDANLDKVDKAVDAGNASLQETQKISFHATQSARAAPRRTGQVAGSKIAKQEAKQQEWLLAQAAAGDSLRPQKDFEDLIDNSHEPFRGVLGHWQHWAQAGSEAPEALQPYLGMLKVESPPEGSPHPLEEVLDRLSYPDHQLQPATPSCYKGLDNAPVTFVETEEQLQEMAEQLAGAAEIAVDLEHHSFRSFLGFTCLMQISDRKSDFLVDTLRLRRHIGPALAPMFANPQVVKVLHGANWDVLWLQRDFGIYIANLFDTGQAARVLQHPGLGLAYLLQRYCDVKADKRYQLADWRMRPLSPEMQLYARMDTHYLLYIYDCLKKELQAAGEGEVPAGLAVPISGGRPGGPLGAVLERSRQLCLTRYSKPRSGEGAAREVLASWQPAGLEPAQEAAFAALFAWRDRVARARDESWDYVLPKRVLLSLAKQLPGSERRLRGIVDGHRVPSLAASLAGEIFKVLALAAAAGPQQQKPDLPSEELPAEAARAAEPKPPQQAWVGPQLHAGLRPQAEEDLLLVEGSKAGPLSETAAIVNPPAAAAFPQSAPTMPALDQLPPGLEPVGQANSNAAEEASREASSPGELPRGRHMAKAPVMKRKSASAFASVLCSGAQVPQESQAVAESIRAQFAIAMPSWEQKQEDPGLGRVEPSESPAGAAGEEIRAVADELRRQQAGAAPEEDFLPLPLSERRKRQRLEERARPVEPAGGIKASDEREARAAAQKAINGAGLGSESDSPSGEETEAAAQPTPATSMPELTEAARSTPAADGSRRRGDAPGKRKSRQAGGEAPSADLQPFDYSSARAAAPGLDLALNQPRGSGKRPERSRGRGGRRNPGGRFGQPNPFNMYQLDESNFMKGGKRSSVMPRSGNKSQTFR